MARSRRNFVCISESGEVKKYASQSIGQIIDEKEDFNDQFISITTTGLHDDSDIEFEELKWFN